MMKKNGHHHAPLSLAVLDPGTRPTKSGRPRLYLHIDMDAFFASVEVRDNPEYIGKPVVVGGGPGNRGVVTTASYEARVFGIHAGMPAMEAKRRCAKLIFLPVNGRKYTYASAVIMKILEGFSPYVRPLSVDEASVEITGTERLFGKPTELARKIKEKIYHKTHLPSTIGIGPNRLIAKMAANLGKPDGILQFDQQQALETFSTLPVDKMIGIGKSTKKTLESLGIFTLGELGDFPERLLKGTFGINGPVLKQMARGEYAGRMQLHEDREPEEKSMGHQRTFGKNISEKGELRVRLVGLAEMVARRARRAKVVGRVLTLKLRYTDFKTPHHQTILPVPTDDEETLIEYSWKLLDEIWIKGKPLRLLGLSLNRLAPNTVWSGQLDLFTLKSRQRLEDLYEAVDTLRDKFGEKVVSRVMGGRYENREKLRSASDIVPFGHLRPSTRNPYVHKEMQNINS